MSYIGNSPGNASQRVVTRKVATAGQTRFASDSGYATGYVDVIVNGADLVAGEDFNETGDGINIDLVEACAADDSVKIIAWIPRGLSDGYTKPEANALLALKADLVAGKIPSSQLPAYVDDVLEYANLAAFPATGSTGIIYVAQDTNNCYRWSGSAYIVLTDLSSYYTKTQADAKYVGKDSSTGAAQLPSGTTAQRPAGGAGKIRHNTTTGYIEYWDPAASTWVGIGAFQAIGGTITESGGYRYHAFTSSGTFQVLAGTKTVEALIVAGGGGGGSTGGIQAGGGGGAGGYQATTKAVNVGETYSVIIGSGGSLGTSGTSWDGTDGTSSSVFGITSIGGGGGGGQQDRSGRSGGSGGGRSSGGGTGSGGSGTSGQGYAGGGVGSQGSPYVGGGGGGAGRKGYDITDATDTPEGGVGLQWSNGVYYAGGGGCGERDVAYGPGYGGNGGGGNGGRRSPPGTAAISGTANTGGGGGGGCGDSSGANAANGGSGIVIIRYPL